jgi:hypothetical protein
MCPLTALASLEDLITVDVFGKCSCSQGNNEQIFDNPIFETLHDLYTRQQHPTP